VPVADVDPMVLEIPTDSGNVFQGRNPKQMVIAQAKLALADVPNAHVFQNNGADPLALRDT
jgi:hypothetical protein